MVAGSFASDRAVTRQKARVALLASGSAAALLGAAWAGAANAQCTGPDVNNVVTCAPGTYSGISFSASNPGLTINVAAGASTTTYGVGATGNGTIVINGDPSDSFTSTLNGVPGLYGITNVGNENLTAGDVVGGSGVPAVDADTNSGDVFVDVASATSANSFGILVGSLSSGQPPQPDNVSVTVGNSSGLPAAVFVLASGNVVVNSGNAIANDPFPASPFGTFVGFGITAESSGGSVQITSGNATATSVNPTAAVIGVASGDVTITSGCATVNDGVYVGNISPPLPNGDTFNASVAVAGLSGQGNVTITSAQAYALGGSGANAIDAVADSGWISITSGVASTTGPGSYGIFALAAGSVAITSGDVTTSGGTFFETGGVTSNSFARFFAPAGNYVSDGIFAQSTGGSIQITAGNISTSGASADGIVANAAGTDTITVTGNISSVQGRGIALASGGSSTVTVQSGASVSGVIGIDGSGANTGLGLGNNTAGVQAGLNVIDDGTITGTGGTAIQFNSGVNTLTLGTGWAINGALVGGTTNNLVLAGSVATQTASQDAPSFANFASLEVTSGYWTLPSAASYATTTVDSGGALEIDTSLAGNLTDNGEVVFNTPGDLDFTGAFGGNGELVKDGAGVLTFDGTYSFSGETVINDGSIDIADLAANATLDVTGGTLNVGGNATIADITGTGGTVTITGNATVGALSGSSTVTVSSGDTVSVGSGDFSGNMSGSGSLEKTGNGTLTLTGNDSLGGNVTVGSGTVNVTGNLSAPQLAVDSGASLGGNGNITGCVTVEAGGTFSPGDPVTTSIFGNLLFAKGSTYLAEVTAAGAHDLIEVKGNVTIDKGSIFEVEPLGSVSGYHLLSAYPVITATGTISGTFSKVLSTMPLLIPALVYTRHDVDLVLVRSPKSFASQAVTPDQAAAAAAIEAGGANSALYQSIVGQSAAGLQAGYSALSGEGYADAPSEMLEQSDETRRTLVERMDDPG
jgi:autotransporter-associated beta strand protein